MIEFQFLLDCTHAADALANLKAAMVELGIPESQLKISVISDIDSAKRMSFQGSPSILLNRKDIYTGEEPTGFSYAYRLYEFKGQRMGVIPKEFIREKLIGIL